MQGEEQEQDRKKKAMIENLADQSENLMEKLHFEHIAGKMVCAWADAL